MFARFLMIALLAAGGAPSYGQLPAPFIWDILNVARTSEFAIDLTSAKRLPS